MDTPEYFVKTHRLVVSQDLPILPSVLEEDFEEFFKPILETDPYECCKQVRCHWLIREPLIGFKAMEIRWNDIDYRLVYRIVEHSKRVDIFSFDHHVPAYHKAEDRVRASTGYRC